MTVPRCSFLFFISSPPVYPSDLYLKHWYNVRLPIGLGCKESDFITHLRLTERTTAGEREGEVKKLNGLWGYLKGTAAALSFSMWSLASISYYIIHHSNQEQEFVCGRGCKGLWFALSLHYGPGASERDRQCVPGQSTIKGAGPYRTFCVLYTYEDIHHCPYVQL